MNTIILVIIAVLISFQVFGRLFFLFVPKGTRKGMYFSNKIEITKQKIWDLEFLKEKTKAIREGFRIEYDRLKENTDAATRRLESEKDKKDKDEKIVKDLESMVKRFEGDMTSLEEQMKNADEQVDGPGGINQQIEGFRTVISLLEEYKKQI